jgi:O-antigen ligase
MFEKEYIPSLVDHAHNDYLEIAAEAGLTGGICLVVFVWGFAVFLFMRWLKRRDHFVRGVGLGCLMGILSILLHSLTDFNLHIPANAVYFVTLYGLAFRVLNHSPKMTVR